MMQKGEKPPPKSHKAPSMKAGAHLRRNRAAHAMDTVVSRGGRFGLGLQPALRVAKSDLWRKRRGAKHVVV